MRTVSRELVRQDPAGFEIWRETTVLPTYTAEEIRQPGDDRPQAQEVSDTIEQLEGASGQTVTGEYAYTPEGKYIGTPDVAELLCVKLGIAPELASPTNKVCSIGFSARDQKWFGWSHRALYGFGIGAIAEEGDCCTTSGWTEEYLAEHPEEDLSVPVGFRAETLDDAKRMAIAFAESVS